MANLMKYFGEKGRKPGRPEIGPAIQVRLPEELLARLDQEAEKKGISRAEAIRRALSSVSGW